MRVVNKAEGPRGINVLVDGLAEMLLIQPGETAEFEPLPKDKVLAGLIAKKDLVVVAD